MNRYKLPDGKFIEYVDMLGMRAKETKASGLYYCCIVAANITPSGNCLHIIWELHDSETGLEYNVISKYEIGSEEYYELISKLYDTYSGIIEVNLNDFDKFYGSCRVDYAGEYPKVNIVGYTQKIVSAITKKLCNI